MHRIFDIELFKRDIESIDKAGYKESIESGWPQEINGKEVEEDGGFLECRGYAVEHDWTRVVGDEPIRITTIEFEEVPHPSCSPGGDFGYQIKLDNGAVVSGRTCNCMRGCNGTKKIKQLLYSIAMLGIGFNNVEDLEGYIKCGTSY